MKFTSLVSAALAVGVLGLTGQSAEAATYYWANTQVGSGSSSVTVGWCAGGTGVINPGGSTTKNVCKVWVPYNSLVDANVRETGTGLIYTAYCGTASGKWVSFNSSTDTSRTAVVTRTRANCA